MQNSREMELAKQHKQVETLVEIHKIIRNATTQDEIEMMTMRIKEIIGFLGFAKKWKPKLATVSPEIFDQIFNYLASSDSTCLGLTCTGFSTFHRSIHGVVPVLPPFIEKDWDQGIGIKIDHEKTLGERLQEWEWTRHWLDCRMAHLQIFHHDQRSESCLFVPRGQKLRDFRDTFSIA